MAWENDFRKRMDGFASKSKGEGIPLSIKVRVDSGCFHREHSPYAYRIIDEHVRSLERDGELRFEEHESGPELLVYAALATAGVSLASNVINLITAIINARKKGIQQGDGARAPLVLIVRGFHKNGELKEEIVLRIDSKDIVDENMIEDALIKAIQERLL